MDRRTLLTGIAGVGGAIALRPSRPLAQQRGGGGSALAAPITGQILDATTRAVTGNFAGTLTIERFAAQGGELVAIGSITGRLFDLLGTLIDTVRNVAVELIGDITSATCTILELTLAPLDLNLLGLMVHLNEVVLTITADPAGGLLGQLLCAIADLDPGSALQAIVDLLNQLLGLFGSV
jgi:hypothetical protein